MPLPEDTWLSRKAAALYLTRGGFYITHRTLDMMATHNNAGKGPPFIRTSWKSVRYNQAELDAWAKKQTVRVE